MLCCVCLSSAVRRIGCCFVSGVVLCVCCVVSCLHLCCVSGTFSFASCSSCVPVFADVFLLLLFLFVCCLVAWWSRGLDLVFLLFVLPLACVSLHLFVEYFFLLHFVFPCFGHVCFWFFCLQCIQVFEWFVAFCCVSLAVMLRFCCTSIACLCGDVVCLFDFAFISLSCLSFAVTLLLC